MEINWLQGLFLGFISGMTEIFPVSAEAHRLLIMKLLGAKADPALLRLMIHVCTVAALYYCCRKHIAAMMRAYRLSRIPKKRRKRPLDMKAMSDFNLLRTALISNILALLLYSQIRSVGSKLLWVAAFMVLNGLILYIPQFLPGANKQSAAMNRVDGLVMGLAGGTSVLPGVSCLGSVMSLGSVLGMEQKSALNLALVMNIPMTMGLAVYDLVDIVRGGFGGLSFGGFLASVLAGATAFAGVFVGIKLLRKIADRFGISLFAFYSWGLALLMFIFYLTAA